MNYFFKKHQDIIILSALLAITLSLLLANLRDKSSLSAAEKIVISAFAPLQEAVAWTVGGVAMIWDDYVYLVNLRQENRELARMTDRLAFENSLLAERLKFYQRMETLLTFPRLDTAEYEAARVIGRDTTDRVKLITLNKGSRHGVEKNMPVVTHKGLVGRVTSVSRGACKALLITDVRSAIDAITQESRSGMVVTGTNTALLEVRYLDVIADVKDGDRVISSGLGGMFPKGLLIGSLTDVKRGRGELFLSAKLIPSADLGGVEEVLILKSPPGGQEAEQ